MEISLLVFVLRLMFCFYFFQHILEYIDFPPFLLVFSFFIQTINGMQWEYQKLLTFLNIRTGSEELSQSGNVSTNNS